MTEEIVNIHDFGTIVAVSDNGIDIKILDNRTGEVIVPMKWGKAAKEWYLKHTEQFPVGQVIEFDYKRYGVGPVLGKMKPAQQKPTPAQKANDILINEKLKAAGLPQNPVETDVSVRMTGQTIGNHDPAKIIEKKLRCHINLGNYEFIELEATGIDIEEMRKMMIQDLSMFGTQDDETAERVRSYLKRVLSKGAP